jgi:hypothetical protein
MGKFSSLHFNTFLFPSFNDSYPPRYIYSRFMKFFTKYLSLSSVLPLLDKENDFTIKRRQLLNVPTITEHQIASRLVQTIEQTDKHKIDNPLVKMKLEKQSTWIDNLIIHYTHETRLDGYKKAIHRLWDHKFKTTQIIYTKLIIGNRNNGNITKETVRRRPKYISCIKRNLQPLQT